MLAGLQLGEQMPGVLLNLGEFRNERFPVHYRVISRYTLHCKRAIVLDAEVSL